MKLALLILMMGLFGCSSTPPVPTSDLRPPTSVTPDINPAHAVIKSHQSADQVADEPAVITPPPDILIPIPPLPGVDHAYLLSAPAFDGPWTERSFDDITILSNGDWRVKPTPDVMFEFYKVAKCETDPL